MLDIIGWIMALVVVFTILTLIIAVMFWSIDVAARRFKKMMGTSGRHTY